MSQLQSHSRTFRDVCFHLFLFLSPLPHCNCVVMNAPTSSSTLTWNIPVEFIKHQTLWLRAVVWMGSAGPSLSLPSWENGLQVFHNYLLDNPCCFSERCEKVFYASETSRGFSAASLCWPWPFWGQSWAHTVLRTALTMGWCSSLLSSTAGFTFTPRKALFLRTHLHKIAALALR